MAPNVGLFAGHTWARKRVMGLEDRAPTGPELAWMLALVDSTMQQGALGLSTGLEYVPAAYAELEEVVALAGEWLRATAGIYVTHMRDEGVRVSEAVRESLEVGRRAGIPVQINHHKVTGAAQWGWYDPHALTARFGRRRRAGSRARRVSLHGVQHLFGPAVSAMGTRGRGRSLRRACSRPTRPGLASCPRCARSTGSRLDQGPRAFSSGRSTAVRT